MSWLEPVVPADPIVAAALLVIAAAGLMRGSSGWRLVIAVVQGIAMALAVSR